MLIGNAGGSDHGKEQKSQAAGSVLYVAQSRTGGTAALGDT